MRQSILNLANEVWLILRGAGDPAMGASKSEPEYLATPA